MRRVELEMDAAGPCCGLADYRLSGRLLRGLARHRIQNFPLGPIPELRSALLQRRCYQVGDLRIGLV
jgi:hypothetical protein